MDDDIAVVRATYLPDVTRTMSAGVPRREGETEAHRLLRMEEAWMMEQGPFSEFAVNLRPVVARRLRVGAGGRRRGGGDDDGGGAEGGGADGDDPWAATGASGEADTSEAAAASREGDTGSFLFGTLLGAYFGILMLATLLLPTTRRFRLGVITGVCIYLALDMWRSSTNAGKTAGSDTGSSGSNPFAPAPIGWPQLNPPDPAMQPLPGSIPVA